MGSGKGSSKRVKNTSKDITILNKTYLFYNTQNGEELECRPDWIIRDNGNEITKEELVFSFGHCHSLAAALIKELKEIRPNEEWYPIMIRFNEKKHDVKHAAVINNNDLVLDIHGLEELEEWLYFNDADEEDVTYGEDELRLVLSSEHMLLPRVDDARVFAKELINYYLQ